MGVRARVLIAAEASGRFDRLERGQVFMTDILE
jgi:hypothetical protein